MAGYEFDIPAGEKAATELNDFGEAFHRVVNALEQSIMSTNSAQQGLTAGGINTGATALDAVAIKVKNTLVDMGGRVKDSAVGYGNQDVTSSDDIGASNSTLAGITGIN